MNTDYARFARQDNWTDQIVDSSLFRSELVRLATDNGSLTIALKELGDDDFRVNVLNQSIAVPFAHEQHKLNRLEEQSAMIREVELVVRDVPVVYARSIIPLSLVNNDNQGLANLGQKPLGLLLFKDGNIDVEKRDFCVFNDQERHHLARRTPYAYEGQSVLVAEFFLPSILVFF